jgi:hypothetical protein
MARIKTYPIDTLVTDKDIILGSDADVFNQTKNFKAETLRNYMLSGLEPEVGGNLKITTITATDEINLTPEDYFNNLEEPLVVLNYEIIFLILNGRTYIFRQNGNTYGIGETQTTASDFTEIDITSIINANLQDLDSVLTEGNESLLDAKVGRLGLWDNSLDNYGYISCISRSKFNFTDAEGFLIGSLTENTLLLNDSDTVFNFQIKKPEVITDNRTATFQNASGTVAYLSDIPEVNIESLEEGNNISITETTPGTFEISAVITDSPKVTQTNLINNITETTYFSGGGLFYYDEITAPINSIVVSFNENIETEEEVIAYLKVTYENSDNDYISLDDFSIDGSNIKFEVPFSTFYSETIRVSTIEICIFPNVIKSVSSGKFFDGNIPSSLSNYFVNLVSAGAFVLENLQKVITSFPYTLTNADDKYTIFVQNSSSDVTINVPNSLTNNFSCVFIQKGTGEVTIQSSGTATLLYPTDLENKIKYQYYWAMVEKEMATDVYYLMGSLKVLSGGGVPA